MAQILVLYLLAVSPTANYFTPVGLSFLKNKAIMLITPMLCRINSITKVDHPAQGTAGVMCSRTRLDCYLPPGFWFSK